MKRTVILTVILFLAGASSSWAGEYYVSNSGNNGNAGSQMFPFRTVGKLLNTVQPGDIGYLRGGVYSLNQATQISGTPAAPITLRAYGTEQPTLRGTGQMPSGGQFLLRHDWYVLRDLRFASGPTGITLKSNASHNVIENCSIYDHYYTGLSITAGAAENHVLNCDAYGMFDSGTNGQNADGFVVSGQVALPGPGNRFTGCRAWDNSDDGFDVWKAGHPVRMSGCLSYDNGASDGDGTGFKLGVNAGEGDQHVLDRCVAWGNAGNGFDYNDNARPQVLHNCTAFNNGRNYKFSNIQGGPAVHDLQNCISAITGSPDVLLPSILQQKTNSWNLIAPNAVGILADNFKSTDDAMVTGPRRSDGSLPSSSFLRLRKGSLFVDAGVQVGLPFTGFAPDFGAYERKLPGLSDLLRALAQGQSSWLPVVWVPSEFFRGLLGSG